MIHAPLKPTVLDAIVANLQANQKRSRLLHIFGVLQSCLTLGAINGANLEKLALAALLHDCAKHVGREETLKLFHEGAIALTPEDQVYPAIWHGTVAAHFAQVHWGITDKDVLQAVEHHTLGCKNPSKTLQILMCADFCEPTRTHPYAEELQGLVRQDLRKGLIKILKLKIEDLVGKDQNPHRRIYSTIESLES
jgi:nicotinate-nucleotide adenylyltransferase